MRMFLSRLHFPVTALGPGRRVGLWFQGCSLRCPGCISVDTWAHGEGAIETGKIIDQLACFAREADGLTVSGGEPFEQPHALAEILNAWRRLSDKSVLVFSGLEMGVIGPWLDANAGLIDAIITGPFRSEVPQSLALRGSDNQRLHVLTDLGAAFLPYDRHATDGDRTLDVMFDEDGGAWMAGIPARGDLARLRRTLSAAGHQVVTSDMQGRFAA
ncbi:MULTISPECIES: 4Fe-4S single cluster domain-containing protein [unclassified Sphingomonas]|uniref:4Fe-4S single cluster domain-containing protein n=1 Tax=Novosphingobium rhizosphaerae TaxID=1551649 RepID=UPI0015CA779F